MRLHHLSNDGQQLADFTVSPVKTTHVVNSCLCCGDSAATPLPKPPPDGIFGSVKTSFDVTKAQGWALVMASYTYTLWQDITP